MNFTQKLQQALQSTDKTQGQLAKASRIKQPAISKFLNHGTGLSYSAMCRLAESLGLQHDIVPTKPAVGDLLLEAPADRPVQPGVSFGADMGHQASDWVGKQQTAHDIAQRAIRELRALGDDPMAAKLAKTFSSYVSAVCKT